MLTAKLNQVQTNRKTFIADPYNFVGLGIALLINIIHWLILYFKIKFSSGTILIHYNIIYGPDFVEKASFAYYIPLTAFLILVVNGLMSMYFYRKEKLASYFLNFANTAIQLIFFAASLIVIYINA